MASRPYPPQRRFLDRKAPASRRQTALRRLAELNTEVTARIDVGLGNAVFIRGQGDGLSWDKGTPLRCQDASTWVWSTTHAKDKLVFKLLLNDAVWARGDDVFVEAGKKIEVEPVF